MKFTEINSNIIGKNVKLVSLKNSKLNENEFIKKNNIYKIYDIDKTFFNTKQLTIQLVDKNLNVFWVNHYDVELIKDKQ